MKAIVIIVCCALLMSLATYVGVKAQEGNWSDPVALSGTGRSVWFPRLKRMFMG